MVKIAINGMGRIGRLVLKCLLETDLEIVAVNVHRHVENVLFLLKHDSVHSHHATDYTYADGVLSIGERKIKVLSEKDPENLPWKELGIDIVIDSTGKFKDKDSAGKHLAAGAKKVVLTAPGKGIDATIVMGINEEAYNSAEHNIVSNASCTTNCLAPIAKVLLERFGIKKGFMTTVHAYTGGQRILDNSHKDPRRARAAALSIIPTTTGAAKAIGLVLPPLKGKLDGLAIRVPTPNVSLVDLVVETEKPATAEEVNAAFKEASESNLKGILGYSEEPLVSIDYNGCEFSGVVDALSTKVLESNLVKVLAWYDNEWGYSRRTADLVELIAKKMEAGQ